MTKADSILLARIDERQIHQGKTQDNILLQVKTINGRLGVVEKWKARLHGAWVAVVCMATILGAIIGFMLKHFIA